ncbi:MAG: hypothetical protein H0X39_18255 [Actinobacteria bacterium]|nr:hypothetical protein [Actinomycetota bacterium]
MPVAEALAADDASLGAADVGGAVADALAAFDTPTAAVVSAGVAAVSEVLALVESVDALAAMGVTTVDSLSAEDAFTSTADLVGVVAEALAAADASDAAVQVAGSGTVYDVTVSDTLAVADAVEASVTLAALPIDGRPSGMLDGVRLLDGRRERLQARDRVTTTLTARVTRRERLTAVDAVGGALIATTASAERLSARDVSLGAFVTSGAMNDALTAADACRATVTRAPIVLAPPAWSLDEEDAAIIAAYELLMEV